MRALTLKATNRAVLVLVLIAAGLGFASSSVSAAPVSINLCATVGTATLAGGVNVPIWGFGATATPGNCAGVTPGLPGPVLTVNVGDTVTLAVTNDLPAGHPLSFEIPGIAFNAGPTDAAVGATVTRTFTANEPGTYLYGSGGDAGRQAAMGLYGALIVRPPTPNQAYNSATTAYDVEALLVLSAIDPAFNAAPETFDMHGYRATYWLINGKAYPDTAPGITAAAGQRVLLRYLNAGYDNTTMLLLGMHERVVARDARPLNVPFDANAETIPAGATEDAIATVPAGSGPSPRGFPLYNRQQHVTNGVQTGDGPTPATGGGMLTFIHH
ncbi:multicopper oxidase domain-containing protein [Micromonospora sp. NPDC047548]|uniref:multicopper oxidase domain-containing protein n=1 Tax=Micromonospora sp. NPDC047548 TaxID=3155624 RepID=UPI0033DDC0D2